MAEKAAPSFDEMVFAISEIKHRAEYRSDTPATVVPAKTDQAFHRSEYEVTDISSTVIVSTNADCQWERPARNRHLVLLDLLLTLLITGDSSDVAVTMLLRTDEYRIIYCKNQPCTAAEREYVEKVFEAAIDCSHLFSKRQDEILKIVTVGCARKIKAHILEIIGGFKTHGDSSILPEEAVEKVLPANVISYLKSNLPMRNGISTWIKGWLSFISDVDGPKSYKDLEAVFRTIHRAYIITQHEEVALIMDHTLFRRIKKLGEYFAIAIMIVLEVDQLSWVERKKLRIEEVLPTTPQPTIIEKSAIEILSQWVNSIGGQPINESQLRTAFKELPDPLPTHNKITLSVHYECTLILKLIQDKILSNTLHVPLKIDIGVSKSLCFFCKAFFSHVKTLYPHFTILISSAHNKNAAGWKLPPEAPSELKKATKQTVHTQLENIQHQCYNSRLSDSYPWDLTAAGKQKWDMRSRQTNVYSMDLEY